MVTPLPLTSSWAQLPLGLPSHQPVWSITVHLLLTVDVVVTVVLLALQDLVKVPQLVVKQLVMKDVIPDGIVTEHFDLAVSDGRANGTRRARCRVGGGIASGSAGSHRAYSKYSTWRMVLTLSPDAPSYTKCPTTYLIPT